MLTPRLTRYRLRMCVLPSLSGLTFIAMTRSATLTQGSHERRSLRLQSLRASVVHVRLRWCHRDGGTDGQPGVPVVCKEPEFVVADRGRHRKRERGRGRTRPRRGLRAVEIPP